MIFPTFKNELKCFEEGYDFVIGCDEAGRGPVAGPVVAAACVLDRNSIGKKRSKNKWYYRVRDSKTTNIEERKKLVKEILEHTLAYGVGEVSHQEIDKINIHHASLLAMRRAVEDLLQKAKSVKQKAFLFVDGRFLLPDKPARLGRSGGGGREGFELEQKAVIDGDAKVLSIAAASIIAKVHRDTIMERLDQDFPGYGFARHKGYNTKEHQRALKKLGVSLVHRKSFVRSI